MSRPKVWYLAFGYPRPRGIEVYLLHYATEMRRQGFDPHIVVFDALPAESHWCLKALRQRRVPIESLEDDTRRMRGVRQFAALVVGTLWGWVRRRSPGREALRRAWTKRVCIRRLKRRLAAGSPDIIHVKGRVIAETWDVLPPERTVLHIATSGRRDASWCDAEVDAFRAFAHRAARIFAPGQGVADTFSREFGITRPVDSIATMSPDLFGVDRARATLDALHAGSAGPARPARRFGTLCRFSPGKGIEQILEVLGRFRDTGVDVPFTFAGDGELEAKIREFVVSRELRNVRVERVLSATAAMDLMDVFVLPSESEAMPLVIVEALMCCRPCIATRVGGVPDLLRNGVEGILVDPCDPTQLFEAVQTFMEQDSRTFAEYAERARSRYAAACAPERVGQQVAVHYRAVIATAARQVGGSA